MFTIHEIDSLDQPALAPYRSMRRQEEHRREGIFVAEGEKVVRRLLAHPHYRVDSLLLPTGRFPEFEAALLDRTENIPVYVGPKSLLETLTGYTLYQGIMAVARIPAGPSWEKLLQPASCLWVAVDGLTNAPNLGAVVRAAAAFGAGAILVGETSSSPWLRRAVRSSMGAVFDVPIVETTNLAAVLQELRRRGVRCLAADPQSQEKVVHRTDLRSGCCLVFGHEGLGLSPEVRQACDVRVAIPMSGGVDSLNVACAAAVLLYEAWRQRAGCQAPL